MVSILLGLAVPSWKEAHRGTSAATARCRSPALVARRLSACSPGGLAASGHADSNQPVLLLDLHQHRRNVLRRWRRALSAAARPQQTLACKNRNVHRHAQDQAVKTRAAGCAAGPPRPNSSGSRSTSGTCVVQDSSSGQQVAVPTTRHGNQESFPAPTCSSGW